MLTRLKTFFTRANTNAQHKHLSTDHHTHLLPGVDDGVSTFEESRDILLQMHSRGIRVLHLTPHCYHPLYPNTLATLQPVFKDYIEQLAATPGITVVAQTATTATLNIQNSPSTSNLAPGNGRGQSSPSTPNSSSERLNSESNERLNREQRERLNDRINPNQLVLILSGELRISANLLSAIQAGHPLPSHNGELLLENSLTDPSPLLDDIQFALQARGYSLVMAHPERYAYWHGDFKHYRRLVENGWKLQLNRSSLSGRYGKGVKNIAEKLVSAKLVHHWGSDLHGRRHLEYIK
ncbi:MAG: CpsB/CapC family capsule biosynthesis tyrosine phosphatase [Marinifilaceae bacterium]